MDAIVVTEDLKATFPKLYMTGTRASDIFLITRVILKMTTILLVSMENLKG